MTDNVIIFSRAGQQLADLGTVSVVRSWNGKSYGRATFTIPADDAQATAAILKGNNRILVRSDLVEDWVGYIWPDPSIAMGVVTVNCFAAEGLLNQRNTYSQELTGTPGQIFTSLINIANTTEDMGITLGEVDISGTSITRSYKFVQIGDQVNRLAQEFNMVYWMGGSYNATTKTLSITANMAANRGMAFSRPIIEGYNFTAAGVSSEGQLANRVISQGRSEENTDTYATADNTTSQDYYGLVEAAVTSVDMQATASLQSLADNALERRAYFYRKAAGIIAYPADATPVYPRIGDTCTVVLGQSGNYTGTYSMLVEELSYDPQDGACGVVLVEVA
jgi:hypothetical protein